MCVGERSAWKASTPTSLGAWRLFPGSVKSGGTWHVAHRAGWLAVGPEGFAVLVELRVKAARAPAGEHLLDGRGVYAEQVRKRLEGRRQRDDRSDVEVAVGPAVEPMPDARRERVVHCGVTGRACNADGSDVAVGIENPGHADDGVQLQQGQRRCRIVEIDLAGLELLLQRRGEGVQVYLEPDREGGLGAHAGPHAAVLFAGDGPMQLQRPAPERLVAEGVEAEGPPPFPHHALAVVVDDRIEPALG